MTPKSHRDNRVRRDLLQDQKGHGVIIRGRSYLLYVQKGQDHLFDRFDLVYDPIMSRGH